ncbi:MAG TPA: hypothetical protein VL361_14390 [Candidatus Limnocylindrales bacterium]|nr:hypothetical protein [Candidatus Limnocylindrales bacterium]
MRSSKVSSCNVGGWSALTCQALVCSLLFSACATDPKSPGTDPRRFDFQKDTFAYPNELVWEYYYNTNGMWTTQRRQPEPTYSLHCVVVARSARQFFDFARFDPKQPMADESTYRRLVRHVIQIDPRRDPWTAEQIIIPGYDSLREFSKAHEQLLKEECGGAWQSYFQRGHWRMIFPFSRQQQQHVAEQLLKELTTSRPPIVHLVRFPSLMINHAILIFAAEETEAEIRFSAYDPNQPGQPVSLSFDRATHTFILPVNSYFPGGRVDVYEIFHQWDY